MITNTKTGIAAIVTVLIVFCLSYLSFTGFSIKEENIKIGGIFHLTGPGAFWGEGEKNGVLMAVEEINSNGGINGKKVELIIEDGGTDFSSTINTIQKLINIDGTRIIVGPTWFGQIASPLAEKLKILMISPSAGVVPEPNSYFFDVWPTERQEVEPVIDYMQEKGIKKVAIVYSLNDFTQSVRNNFAEQTKAMNITIVEEFPVSPNEEDFKTVITQIKELKIDALYATFAFYPSQGAFSKQARELGLNATIYSTSGTEMPDLVKAYPEIEGTIYSYRASGPSETEFNKKYMQKFNSFPSPSSAYAYDSSKLVFEALKSGKKKPEEISAYLKTISYPGVSNSISFDKDGRITSKQFILKTVSNGEFVVYG